MHATAADLDNLVERVQDLRNRFAETARALDRAAENLRAGVLPDQSLARHLDSLSAAFLTVRGAVDAAHLDATGSAGSGDATIDNLEASLATAADAARAVGDRVERVRTLLQEVLRLQPAAGKMAPDGLAEAHAQASALLQALSQAPAATVRDLSDDGHPLVALLVLVDGSEDDAVDRADTIVADTYGRRLSLAANRRDLVRGSDTVGGGVVEPGVDGPPDTGEGFSLDAPAPNDGAGGTPPSPVAGAVPEVSGVDPRGTSDETTGEEDGSDAALEEKANEPNPVDPGDPAVTPPHVDMSNADDPGTQAVVERAANADTPADEVDPFQSTVPDPFLQVASAQVVATALVGGADPQASPALVWALLGEGRAALAFHVARAAEGRGGRTGSHPTLSAPFLRAITLGPHLQSNVGDVASILQDDFADFEDQPAHGRTEQAVALGLFAVAAALRPALLAPHTNAPFVLNLDLERTPALQGVCQAVAAFAQKGQPLQVDGLPVSQGWREEWDALNAEARQWLSGEEEKRKIRYQAGTRVWQNWVRTGGVLHGLVEAVLNDRDADIEEVGEELERLRGNIGREIDSTTQALGLKTTIEARAREELCVRAERTLNIPRRWLELRRARPAPAADWVADQSVKLVDLLLASAPDVTRELAELLNSGPSRPLAAAAESARETFEALIDLVSGGAVPVELRPEFLLNAPLLKIPGLHLNDSWEADPTPDLYDRLVQHIARADHDWETAFEERVAAEDFADAARVLDVLGSITRPDDPHVENLRRRRDRRLDATRASYEREADDILGLAQEAFDHRLLDDADWDAWRGRIGTAKKGVAALDRFGGLRAQFDALRDLVQQRRAVEVRAVLQRFESDGVQAQIDALPPPHLAGSDDLPYGDVVRARVRAALDAGDVPLAHEYLEAIEDGSPLPGSDPGTTAFDAFFPDLCQADYEAYGETLGAILRQIGKELERNAHHLAADMVKEWDAVRKQRRINKEQAPRILTGLGFDVKRCSVERGPRYTYLDVDTEPVADRTRCPIPSYGSLANGRYRVLCVYGDLTNEQIVEGVRTIRGDAANRRAVLVFYFGRIPVAQRRALARLSAEPGVRLSFAVLDDLLLLHLFRQGGVLLRSFFDCALPFANVGPVYVTDSSGAVPPEMFYGREDERARLMDPLGAGLVYGGRQLGKTALLRDVQKRFDAPPDRVAEYVDLRSMGFGGQSSPEQIWPLLIHKLRDRGVIPEATKPKGPGLGDALKRWFDGGDERRVLVLLDEADDFLLADEQEGFAQSNRFLALMEETGRRFKVVFAGLHNVLRFTKQSNHPLAHLGEPIQIGPLLRDEAAEARALIESPLATLGYRFESPDLVTLIRSHTNSYPSLLQLYGDRLLKDLGKTRPTRTDGPPYKITRADVDRTYRSRELRDAIRAKFELTLGLDPRYALLTYVIAYDTLDEPDVGLQIGYESENVREQARVYWPDGFRGASSHEDVDALLSELVGLGVLRRVEADGPTRYALRSPNLLPLLGDQAELARRISAFDQHEQLPKFDRATFRRPSGNDRRAPLTASQTDDLLGVPKSGDSQQRVAIIVGTRAAGLDRVVSFLHEAGRQPNLPVEVIEGLQGGGGHAALIARLDALRAGPKAASCFLVPRSALWSETWVEAALDWVRKRKAEGPAVCVAFEAGPDEAWILERNGAIDDLFAQGVHVLTLQPWHDDALRVWLADNGVNTQDERKRATDITGNWPFLLEHVLKSGQAGNLRLAIQNAPPLSKDPALARDFLSACGLDDRDPARRDLLLRLVLSDDGQGVAPEYLVDGGDDLAHVSQVLRWADRLGLARPAGDGRWRADPAVGAAFYGDEPGADALTLRS